MNNLKEFLNEEYYDKYKGKNLVVYIYPKDNTSGCTIEADGFSEIYDEFQKLNTEVVAFTRAKCSAKKLPKQKEARLYLTRI